MQSKSGISLVSPLPLEFRAAIIQEEEFQRAMGDNLILLRALMVWDEEGTLRSEEEDRSLVAQLQIKMDLLLTLMSAGIRGLEPLPAIHPCQLSSEFLLFSMPVAWLPQVENPCGAIYLHPKVALPLLLPALRLAPVADQGPSREWRLDFRLSSVVQEILSRLIFRYHRRQIARSRENADTLSIDHY